VNEEDAEAEGANVEKEEGKEEEELKEEEEATEGGGSGLGEGKEILEIVEAAATEEGKEEEEVEEDVEEEEEEETTLGIVGGGRGCEVSLEFMTWRRKVLAMAVKCNLSAMATAVLPSLVGKDTSEPQAKSSLTMSSLFA